MPNVTKGTKLRGLLEYLWGPGKRDEHRNPHIVAGYDEPTALAPGANPDVPGRWSLGELAAKLNAPHEALGARGISEYVLHVSLSVRSDERPISEPEWQQIAHMFVERMGLAGTDERAGCRWIAMHHGPSAGGNDHIHIVATRATEDGAPVYLRGEWPRSHEICDEIEDAFGLRKDTPGRRTAGRTAATPRRGVPRPEMDRARRAGRPVPDRQALRCEVRAALAGARDERHWIATMKGAGLLVSARADKRDPTLTVGYAVAYRPDAFGPPTPGQDKPRWLSGRLLDGDLSLNAIRGRWTDGEQLSPAQWRAVQPPEVLVLSGPQRIEVWRSTVATLDSVTAQLSALPADSPHWPSVVRASADALAVTAVVAEPRGYGPVSSAADILARAAASPRGAPPATDSLYARQLATMSGALLVAGAVRQESEVAMMVAVMLAMSQLILAVARLRDAQRDVHAAGAAYVAAERILPLLHKAQQAGLTPAAIAQQPRTAQTVIDAVEPAVGTARLAAVAPSEPRTARPRR